MDKQKELIFSLAEEIGEMIKETDEFKEFERASVELGRSDKERDLLERYIEIEENIRKRREAGDIIEQFIDEEADSLRESVMKSGIIKAYLLSRDRYIALLELVQKELSGSRE